VAKSLHSKAKADLTAKPRHSQLSRGIVPGVAESNGSTWELITARQSTFASEKERLFIYYQFSSSAYWKIIYAL